MKAEIFSHQLTVSANAIDVRNHVNNLKYLEWCLDAAQQHWNTRASSQLKSHYVWYVLQHHIDYKAAAFLDEILEVRTWVEIAEGVKSTRRYEIFRKNDHKLLVDAKTIWCLLDSKTLRPAKITEEIRTLFI